MAEESRLVGILYHPRVPEAHTLAKSLTQVLQARAYKVWSASAWDEQEATGLMAGTLAVVSIGGDGTILRAARAVIPQPIPILGIRFGRLGFIAEVPPETALERVPPLLEGEGHVEVRAMLQATLARTKLDPALREKHHPLLSGEPGFHALNEVMVARGAPGRPINVQVTIDGQLLTTYRADGVTVATATGSTGYVLSTGGPILRPTSECYVLTPVAPHATLNNAIVLEPESIVDLTVYSDHGATVSIDGQVDVAIEDGETITIRRSPYSARFLRTAATDHFYASLIHRLRFGESAG